MSKTMIATVLWLTVGTVAAILATRAPVTGSADESRRSQTTLVDVGYPSPWLSSRGYVVGAVSAVAVQVLLVGWLLVEHRQRRRAEAEVEARLREARTQLVTIAHLDRRAVVGEVTAAIAHELNQPLEAILHNAEAGEMMIESGVTSLDEMRQIFADIRRIDLRAAEIIHRLRGLLRKREFETASVDVHELIVETAALVAPVAGSKGVQIDLALAAPPVPVLGDRVHLQQVVLNVLLNAIDAMCDTSPSCRQITIETRIANGDIEIAVRDRGHGIRAGKVSQIFEPFYTTKGEGMGIGLSISRSIVEAHGGRIGARNNPDNGATVWFSLPSGVAMASASVTRLGAVAGMTSARTCGRASSL